MYRNKVARLRALTIKCNTKWGQRERDTYMQLTYIHERFKDRKRVTFMISAVVSFVDLVRHARD